MPNPILQFGTSRFLQAHVDLFTSEALPVGRAVGEITVVQTTSNAQSAARIAALRSAGRYPVEIRGLRHGEIVERRIECSAITEALHANEDWALLRERVACDVRMIVSNTGDSGYAQYAEDDASLLDGQRTPRGFGAKLAVLLHERYRAGGPPITLLPCELVSRNGDVLRDLVVEAARNWRADEGFVHYLDTQCVWVNSLVDRIVSEPILPVGAVAEPYALWAVERTAGMTLPCEHRDIVVTDDLARYERLKLFLLNLGHTVLAEQWLARGREEGVTVVAAMDDAAYRAPLEAVWNDEVLPVFEALGQREAALSYLDEVRERFANPFLAHRLAEIATHHELKKQRRLLPVVELARELKLDVGQPRLRAALG
ncbi:MAG: mannitol dehydrogenase family protein [Paraburkholderia sp.]|nr:mannitol dehydrogenase family protein [Paraburkholderia sp.]